MRSQVAGQRYPLAGQTHYQVSLTRQVRPTRARTVQTTGGHYTSESATPIIAAINEINQKRCTTWVSLQPSNSK